MTPGAISDAATPRNGVIAAGKPYTLAREDPDLRELDAKGSDARGSPVHRGLFAAMERMNRRRDARIGGGEVMPIE